MADNFLGYLIKNGSSTLSMGLLVEDGYSSTPDIQQDKNSYTDGLGDTHRTILPHVKQKIWLKFRELTVAEKQHVQTVLPNRTMITLTYWNDERESYAAAKFYIPDITWTINRIDKATGKRYYSGPEITLISYGEAKT